MSKLKVEYIDPATNAQTLIVSLSVGEIFSFVKPIHQNMDVSDIFMRIMVSSTYRSDRNSEGVGQKYPIVNLTKHKLSMVEGDREIIRVNATLKVSLYHIEETKNDKEE